MRALLTLLAGAMALATAAQAQAGPCCDHCGCDCGCRKVCRLVCETKKVTKTVYDCKCEDFCVPCPSECIGTKCACPDECSCGLSKLLGQCCKERIYQPTGAQIHTKQVLIKRTETKEVPSYKWVVETLCDHCCRQCAHQGTAGNEPPQDPAAAAGPIPGPPLPAPPSSELEGPLHPTSSRKPAVKR